MKAARLALAAVLLGGLAACASAAATDGGGRDVSVALFTTHDVRALTITPAGGAWIAQCATCAHQPLTAPMHVSGDADLFAGGTLRVRDEGSHEERSASGLWHVRGGQSLDVVLTIPSERYVAAVVSAEAAPNEPPASLRALAVLARTYALNGKHYQEAAGHLAADLCDSTQCQAMRLGAVSAAVDDAVRETAGETLWFGPRRAQVFFSQSCGGITEDAGAVWPELRGLPYLRGHADPYCVRRDAARWHAEVSLRDFVAIARGQGWKIPGSVVAVRVDQRSVSHRALRVVFAGADGSAAAVSASALRLGIGRALGWNLVRSDAYELALRNGTLVFDGRGHGHGVGLCQQGAAEMAAEGKSAREILAFYFPGTEVRITPEDHGWQEGAIGSLTVRAADAVSSERLSALAQLWTEARRRFAPRATVSALIVFAPTTEMFRQMTSQPGWMLASTRGRVVVLQPEAVLRAHGDVASSTELHEMLHVLVESEASDRAPLWLREGLVEVLAGERGENTAPMRANDIDEALLRGDTLATSQRAHRAAAALTQRMIARYGFSTVRSWLTSGVPAGAGG